MPYSYLCSFVNTGKIFTEENKLIIKEEIEKMILLLEKSIFSPSIISEQDDPSFLKRGSQVLFVKAFTLSDGSKLVFKPYLMNFIDIAWHHLSANHFNEIYNSRPITINDVNLYARTAELFAVGSIPFADTKYSFLIQEYLSGNEITPKELTPGYSTLNAINSIFTDSAKNGFITDPLVSNWRLEEKNKGEYILDYIDLIWFNDPKMRLQAVKFEEKLDRFII